jgi:hypothetical protein
MQRREEMALSPRIVVPPKSQVWDFFVELGHVENLADRGRRESPNEMNAITHLLGIRRFNREVKQFIEGFCTFMNSESHVC